MCDLQSTDETTVSQEMYENTSKGLLKIPTGTRKKTGFSILHLKSNGNLEAATSLSYNSSAQFIRLKYFVSFAKF